MFDFIKAQIYGKVPEEKKILNGPRLSSVQIQQEYFENLPDCDWVKYEYQDRKYILQNVAFALFGSPTLEGNMVQQDSHKIQLEEYKSRQEEQAMNISSKLCEQTQINGELPEEKKILNGRRLSSVQIQQEYFEKFPDCDLVKYEYQDRKYILQNVAFALFGSPTLEGNMVPQYFHKIQLEGYKSRQKEQAMNIYSKLCEQSKYSHNDKDIYMSVILIVCVSPKPLQLFSFEPPNYWVDLHERTDEDIDIWCTAVFRIRKCIPTTVGAKSCKIYIDENGRVYHSWESYLSDNTLPKCVIVAPKDGEYQGINVEGEERLVVELSVTPSPSLGLTALVLSSADTASTIASVGALGVVGAAMFTPVAPVVLTGVAVAGVTTGLYGIARSSLHLHDRMKHEQTLSPLDPEARGAWLHIASSSTMLAAGAASTLLAEAAAAGNNLTQTGRVLSMSVDVLRHANVITGGVGVLNGLIHIIVKYNEHGEKPTTLELFQFSAATLFFCQSVISNQTAESIVKDAQAKTINEYRGNLRSNRHRKIFDKLSSETRRVNGAAQGNVEVIRGIKNIGNKDQYFADVLKINKDINRYKLRISMTSDGHVQLNQAHRFNPSDLYSMGGDGRARLFSSIGPASVTSPNVPTGVLPTTAGQGYINKEEGNFIVIQPGEIIRFGSLMVRLSTSGAEYIAELLQNLSEKVYAKLITVASNILSDLLPEAISKLVFLCPDEDLLSQVVKFLFDYLKRQQPLGQVICDDYWFLVVLKQFFQDGVIRKETIIKLYNLLLAWINDEIDARRKRYPHQTYISCQTCHGVRYI